MRTWNRILAACAVLIALVFSSQASLAQNFPVDIQTQFDNGSFVLTDSGFIDQYVDYYFFEDDSMRERFLIRYEVGGDSVHDGFASNIPLFGYIWLEGARRYTKDDLFFNALKEATFSMQLYLEQIQPIEYPIDNFYDENFFVDLAPSALLATNGSFYWIIEDEFAVGDMFSGGPDFCLGTECEIGGSINLIGINFVETAELVFDLELDFQDNRDQLYSHYSSSPDFKGEPGFFISQTFQLGLGCVGEGSGIIGDLNADGEVNLLDVSPFVCVLTSGEYVFEADVFNDGVINLLDVDPFIALLID